MTSKKLLFIFTILFFTVFQLSIFSQIQHSKCRNGLTVYMIGNTQVSDSMLISVGNGCIVQDVNVIVDTLRFTWDGDLRIHVRKGTVGTMLADRVGGSGDDFMHTRFDDSASINIASGTAPFTGSYRPTNPLTPFNGISPDGYWKLIITDTAGGDTGYLRAWCLQITFTCPTGGIQTVEIPNTYRLYQNYPNPFNPVTKIKYGVPVNGYIKLTVYDELGKEVQIVDEGYKEANTYEAVFDATNLPSGVYYYKLESESFTDTKKMVIIK